MSYQLIEYVKKPVVVNAVRFTEENKDHVFSWARGLQSNIDPSFRDDKPVIIIPTLEGDMICSLGDYLIQEPFPTDWRKLYPCKAEIFEQTYELHATSLTAPVPDGKEEESIECPYCSGFGYDVEHTNHKPEEPCIECPIQVPCGYCYGSGKVTTKLMKEHIEFDKASKYLNDDGLPF